MANTKHFLSVDLVADENCAFAYEDDLIKFLELIYNSSTSFLMPWLKMRQNWYHHLSVDWIIPCEIALHCDGR